MDIAERTGSRANTTPPFNNSSPSKNARSLRNNAPPEQKPVDAQRPEQMITSKNDRNPENYSQILGTSLEILTKIYTKRKCVKPNPVKIALISFIRHR
jgi:hypothetical protein